MPHMAYMDGSKFSDNIMCGYGLRVRALAPSDIEQWPDLRKALVEYDVPPTECIAVEGEDLGTCLAAVVHMRTDSQHPLVWVDADGKGGQVDNPNRLADSIAAIVVALIPGVKEAIDAR